MGSSVVDSMDGDIDEMLLGTIKDEGLGCLIYSIVEVFHHGFRFL